MADPTAVQAFFFQEIQAGEEKLGLGEWLVCCYNGCCLLLSTSASRSRMSDADTTVVLCGGMCVCVGSDVHKFIKVQVNIIYVSY